MDNNYGDILAGLSPYPDQGSVTAYRQKVQQWCQQLGELGLGRLGLPADQGGDPEELLKLIRCLVHFDLSLFVKFGVHVGLVQGCIARLGTSGHRKWLDDTWNFRQLGCFAMTETDHGSNVRGLETRAVYLKESQQFQIHTPHRGAWKDYIGSALSAHFAIVFAQFQEHGVHPFLVPLRDSQGQLLAGIEVEDCGPKMGLNGVDNGRLAFHQVTVPRENLLDRYASVSADGTYSSPITNPTRRFFTMLGNLVDGRLSLVAASYELSRAGLEIAIGYGQRRRQFGPPGQPETPLMEYQMHQVRLLPRLAVTVALEKGVELFRKLYHEKNPELESFAAALKAYSTWSLQETLRLCRECCGGWGYLSAHRLPQMRVDSDIFTTFEGDNTVLCFLVARNLLKQLQGCRGLLQWIPWPRRMGPDLASPEVLLSALRFREQRLLSSLGRRLRHRLKLGQEPFAALGECQQHAVLLSQAHAERRLLEQFEPGDRWGQLYGLSCVVQDRGWFLEQSYLSPKQSRAARSLHLQMCRDFKDEALQVCQRTAGTNVSCQ